MERQGVVEFVASIDYELFEADANANPSFELLYAEPHLYVPSGSVGGFQQGESLAIAAAGLLRGDAAVYFNRRRSQSAPIVSHFTENVGRYFQYFLGTLQIALNRELAEYAHNRR